jgi:hypothetical protein
MKAHAGCPIYAAPSSRQPNELVRRATYDSKRRTRSITSIAVTSSV